MIRLELVNMRGTTIARQGIPRVEVEWDKGWNCWDWDCWAIGFPRIKQTFAHCKSQIGKIDKIDKIPETFWIVLECGV